VIHSIGEGIQRTRSWHDDDYTGEIWSGNEGLRWQFDSESLVGKLVWTSKFRLLLSPKLQFPSHRSQLTE